MHVDYAHKRFWESIASCSYLVLALLPRLICYPPHHPSFSREPFLFFFGGGAVGDSRKRLFDTASVQMLT